MFIYIINLTQNSIFIKIIFNYSYDIPIFNLKVTQFLNYYYLMTIIINQYL